MARSLGTQNRTMLDLGALFERNARRRAAVASVRCTLHAVDAQKWHVEESVVAGPGVSLTFVVVGPTGIFALVVTDGSWSLSDIKLLTCATRSLDESVPSFARPIYGAIVIDNSAAAPRLWFAPDGSSAWV